MRIAVLSDVHGNLAALEAVLTAAEDEGCDEVWFLGDAVGYGPNPDEVCLLLSTTASVALAGNHDLAVVRPSADLVAGFNPRIVESLEWMLEQLSEPSIEWLLERESSLRAPEGLDGVGLYHASPRDPVWEYVLSESVVRGSWRAVSDQVIFVGHSHIPLAYAERPRLENAVLQAREDWLQLGSERWILNPGSVGQPRDGDWRASFLVFDSDSLRVRFQRVPYDVTRTMEASRRIPALPESWAARLALGQ